MLPLLIHQQIPRAQVEERRGDIRVIGGCFLIFCSTFIYLFWPESKETFDMFVMDIVRKDGSTYRQMISKQAYYDYLAARGAWVLFHVLMINRTRFKWQMWVFTLAWFGYLLDYVIAYNQPYFFFNFLGHTLPGMYALFMAIVLFSVTIITAFQEWKR